MKKKHALSVIGAVFMISFFILAAHAVVTNGSQSVNYKPVPQAASGVTLQDGKQVVKLYMKGSTYFPNPISLKKDVPAVLEVDTNSITGCFRSIQIPAFGIRKTVSPSNNKIEFTPNKVGTFAFSCYMNMGKCQIAVGDGAVLPVNPNLTVQDVTQTIICEENATK